MALVGVPSNYRTPVIASQITFGTGESIAGGGRRNIMIIDQMLSTGTWTANTVITPELCRSESQVKTGAGAGSAIHRAWRAITAANKNCDIYILPVALTTGGSPTAAVSTFTLAGTTASGTGTVDMDLAEDLAGKVTYYSGEALATIATRVRNFINGKDYLPFAATGSGGAITLTAKAVGARWGNGTTPTVRLRLTTTGSGITVSGGGDLGATTAGTDGSTTEAAQVNTALASIVASRYYYLVYGDATNATAMANLRSYLGTSSTAIQNRRMKVIAGARGTKAATITLANAANYERQLIAHQAGSAWTPEQLAGQLAATMQYYQDSDATHGFVNHSSTDWLVPGAPDSDDWPSGTDISDEINNGISVIGSRSAIKSYLPMLVTTRSKDASGSFDDFRACEDHRISGADFVIDDLEPKLTVYQGQKRGTRPTLPDGGPDLNYTFPKGAIDEYVMIGTFKNNLRKWENIHLQRLDDTIASLLLTPSSTNAGATIASFNLYSVDIQTQIFNDVSEASRA